MATSTLKTRIKHKIDTASNWASSNLVPLEGELVIYKGDRPQIKVGDGSTAVGSLPFIKAGSDIIVTQVVTSGTKIATIEIDGALNNLYAPSTIAWGSVTSKPSYYDAKAIKSISRSGTTFTATHLDGTTSTFTQQDNNTTYSAGTGISLSGTTFSNSGVRSIATGSSNGTISVNTNGTSANVAVKGLGSNAYTSTAYLPLAGGIMTGNLQIGNSSSDATTADPVGIVVRDLRGVTMTPDTLGHKNAAFYFQTTTPDNTWKSILRVKGWSSGYVAWELAGPASNNTNFKSFYVRSGAGDTWDDWEKLLTSKNYTSYCAKASHSHMQIRSGNNQLEAGGGIYDSPHIFATYVDTGYASWGIGKISEDNLGWLNYDDYSGAYLENITLLDGNNYTDYTVTKTGGGASGTWKISISGNAGSATKATQDGNGKVISSTYLPLSGGTMTGSLTFKNSTWNLVGDDAYMGDNDQAGAFCIKGANGTTRLGFCAQTATTCGAFITYNGSNLTSSVAFYGAVWNDYAEYRNQNEPIKPGYITYCDDDGKLKKTTERLQKFEGVVSDTFGFAIGETDDCKTPLAVSGRALVYCDPEDKFHSGDCVCAGPDGLAYHMTREEIIEFPDRIVGVVSEIPTYETWGTGNVEVNGRIWIRVR